ncbi:MAG: hypothetical protein P4M15_06115 [Alphaproteobacteria bacterium]|nr:hypothetical protein [Alphaproteobacteria bacterium]
MEMKRPASTNGRAMEKLCGDFHCPFTLLTFRAQHVANRFALPIETAAIIAALAFGGAAHG